MAKLTPMFRQYRSVKRQYPDVLLLFRMGDFYELFFEDAEVAARELELTLTSREAGKGNRVPMCGVPYHAVQRYLARLIKKGYRAAICEQVEDPKRAKGLVKREVTRVITPGTALEDDILEGRANNYLAALARHGGTFGLAVVDVSTGEFRATEIGADGDTAVEALLDELARVQPAECLLPEELHEDEALRERIATGAGTHVTRLGTDAASPQTPAQRLTEHFRVSSLRGYGLEDMPAAIEAAAHALDYLRANHLAALPHLTGLSVYHTTDYMVLDAATRRNLELERSVATGSPEGTVLALLDRTVTPMGARLCRRWLLHPLLDRRQIERRHDAVEAFVSDQALSQALGDELRGVYDLERLISRTAAGTAGPRDLRSLHDSILRLPAIAEALAPADAALLQELREQLDTLDDVADLVDRTIVEDPPVQITEGGIIRDGYNAELDELRRASGAGKEWIARLEASERRATGIKSLRVGFNQVFGYYLEVSKPNLHLVPEHYIRKQTLTNAERFITPDLKEQEAKVLGAEEKIAELEQRLFSEIRAQVAQHAPRVLQTARALAQLDVLLGFSRVAVENAYSKPTVDDSDEIRIAAGRHPVVEHALVDRQFVPNDCLLNCSDTMMLIVTGPNMAGKSTYLRQVALIALLAQIGSFVPAKAARIGLVDRIFTRVGAFDDLASGQSTFMVEMNETANILHN
ncbi:MAG: DNA mismatch repair protein MutS, partial [Armatimonadota bacterium]